MFLFDETPHSSLGGLSESEENTNLFLPALKILERLAAVLSFPLRFFLVSLGRTDHGRCLYSKWVGDLIQIYMPFN